MPGLEPEVERANGRVVGEHICEKGHSSWGHVGVSKGTRIIGVRGTGKIRPQTDVIDSFAMLGLVRKASMTILSARHTVFPLLLFPLRRITQNSDAGIKQTRWKDVSVLDVHGEGMPVKKQRLEEHWRARGRAREHGEKLVPQITEH